MPYRRLPQYYPLGQPYLSLLVYTAAYQAAGPFGGGRLDSGKAFACMDRLLDEQRAGRISENTGHCQVVADKIRAGAACDYGLHAWVVMPNHVHLLITPHLDASALRRRLNGASACESNLLVRENGPAVWAG